MPTWVDTIRAHYGSDSSRQFVLYGNTEDIYPLAPAKGLGRRANAIRRAYPEEEWWFDNFDRNNPDLKDKLK